MQFSERICNKQYQGCGSGS